MKQLADSSDYEIRYSKLEDHTYLKKWISPPEARRWYPISSDQDVEDMTKNWIGFSRFGASLTALYKEKPVGIATLFLMPYRKLIHHALMYFIVSPSETGHGFGTSLARNITHLGKVYFRFEKVHVEVYEGCPAIPLLKKGGYEEVVRQERFVKEGEGRYLARILLEHDFKG